MKRKTLEQRMAERVNRKKEDVFLRKDFEDLGGYDQVGRGLRQLVSKGKLVRIGYGLYAKTRESVALKKSLPAKPLPELTRRALARLRVEVEPSSAQKAYNEGRSTQVPTGRVIGVQGRISRRIGYDGRYMSFERTRAGTD